MPSDDHSTDAYDMYNHVFNTVSQDCTKNNVDTYVLGGDFNNALNRETSRRTIALNKCVYDENCITNPVTMSDWNIDMSITCEQSLFWHGLWKLCGKHETVIMRFTRNNYNYKINKMNNESRSRAKQSLAIALVNNRTRDYWSEIKTRSTNQRLSQFLLLMVNIHIQILQTCFHVSINQYTTV